MKKHIREFVHWYIKEVASLIENYLDNQVIQMQRNYIKQYLSDKEIWLI